MLMMTQVEITAEALEQRGRLPIPIQQRVNTVFARLMDWPQVSGAKALRGKLGGNWRIRTGDYRVIFRVKGDVVTVWKIGYRGGIYD